MGYDFYGLFILTDLSSGVEDEYDGLTGDLVVSRSNFKQSRGRY